MPRSNDKSDVVLRLLDGRSEQRELVLDGGLPRPPFAVGSGGAWCVEGGHVAKAHVMLAFNGAQLYVCAAPGEKALLDGAALDARWIEAAMPSVLRFGSARLSIGRRSGPEEETQIPRPSHDEATRIADVRVSPAARSVRSPREDEATCFDDERLQAALRLSVKEEVTCVPEVAAPVAARSAPAGTTPMRPLRRPAIRTLVMTRPPPLPIPKTPLPERAAPAVLRDVPQSARTLAAPEMVSAGVVEEASEGAASSMPPTIPSEGLMPAAYPSFEVPFKVAAWRPSSPTMAVPRSEGAAAAGEHDTSFPRSGDSVDGMERSALAFAGDASSSTPSASSSGPRRRLGELVQGWKQASMPKRAIALLMIPALIAAALTVRPAANVAGRSAVTAPAGIVATPQAAPPAVASSAAVQRAAAAAGMTAVTAAGAGAAPSEHPKRAASGLLETRTAERRALDAAASGQEPSAIEQYEALAAAQPDKLAFREAARILRARSATQHD